MGGTSNGMGGASTQQTGAPNANLSQLFMQNAPTNMAGGGAQLPQITAPARPAMQMPPRIPLPQAPAPMQQMGRPAQMPDFGSSSGNAGRWGPGGWRDSIMREHYKGAPPRTTTFGGKPLPTSK